MFELEAKNNMTFDSLLEEDIDSEITAILESISNDEISLFECLIESANVRLLTESNIVDGFLLVVKKLGDYIRSLYDKFVSVLLSLIKPAEGYIEKYKDKLAKLTDDELSNLVYEYKKFNIPKNIPVIEYTKDIDRYLKYLENGELTPEIMNELNETFGTRLSIIRGRMLGFNKPIPDENFNYTIKKVFRTNTEVLTKHLTKEDLERYIEEIRNYSKIKNENEKLRNALMNTFNEYSKLISKIYTMDYSSEESDIILKTSNGKVLHLDLVQGNMYRQYQTVLSQFVIEICNSYMQIFKEKLAALKEQYQMNYAIIKQVIFNIK